MNTENKSILFVSCRITFGVKLYGDLQKYGFKLYSQIKEQQINEKLLICQIDSLLRINHEKYEIKIFRQQEL